MYIYIYMYAYTLSYIVIDIYIYIYIYIHTHIHTHCHIALVAYTYYVCYISILVAHVLLLRYGEVANACMWLNSDEAEEPERTGSPLGGQGKRRARPLLCFERPNVVASSQRQPMMANDGP